MSDNTAGLCPEVCAALSDANAGAAASYGDDQWTQRLCDRVRELFEIDCDVFVVSNGTAANALAFGTTLPAISQCHLSRVRAYRQRRMRRVRILHRWIQTDSNARHEGED